MWTAQALEQQAIVAVSFNEPTASLRRFSVASIEDAIERLYFLAKVERGVAQADTGETLSHEAARKRLLK